MALLFGLHFLGYRKLVVCHLNHRLRGAAAKADSLLARSAAGKLRLRFELGEADVQQYAVERTAFPRDGRTRLALRILSKLCTRPSLQEDLSSPPC